MDLEQRQDPALVARIGMRLYTFARKDAEWAIGIMVLLAFQRAALLHWPPTEFATFAFYRPLVSPSQSLTWFILAVAGLVALYIGRRGPLVVVTLVHIFLWAIEAWVFWKFSESWQLSLTPAVYLIANLCILLRLAVSERLA